MTQVDRRAFLRTGAKYAGGALAAPSLIGLMACNDVSPSEPAGELRLARASRGAGGYGPIAADPGGLPFLIPAGFTLRQISKAGDPMNGKPQYNSTGGGTPVGVPLPATWVDVAVPDSVSPSCFNQGLALGGTRFARLEGCWWGDNSVYFNATSGGAAGAGQVWQYRPITANSGQLVLIFESPSTTVLDSPDNICVSPRGGLVICEDGGGAQFLRGLTKQGMIFDFVRSGNPNSATEFAGACFSPDGNILFFNTQGSTSRNGTERGGTFAMWGPWTTGAL